MTHYGATTFKCDVKLDRTLVTQVSEAVRRTEGIPIADGDVYADWRRVVRVDSQRVFQFQTSDGDRFLGRITSATWPAVRAIPGPTIATATLGRGKSMGPGLKAGVISVKR